MIRGDLEAIRNARRRKWANRAYRDAVVALNNAVQRHATTRDLEAIARLLHQAANEIKAASRTMPMHG